MKHQTDEFKSAVEFLSTLHEMASNETNELTRCLGIVLPKLKSVKEEKRVARDIAYIHGWNACCKTINNGVHPTTLRRATEHSK